MDTLIRSHKLFSDLSEENYREALVYFHAHSSFYKRGETINRLGEPLPAFGLVLEGTVQVFMHDYDGQPIIMAHVHAGDTFGESLSYLELETSVMIYAETDSRILWLHTQRMKTAPRNELEHTLTTRFIAMLAQRALNMNDRIQVLSKITLRAKLITFLSQYAQRNGSDFDLPFNRETLAIYLGTDRSALSRELSRMQKEGLISYHKNHFSLIHHEE